MTHPALETLMLAMTASRETNGPSTPEPDSTLFLGAVPHPDLHGVRQLTGWQPFKPLANAWDHAGFQRTDNLPDGLWPRVLLLPGKSRDETLLMFSQARNRLAPGGEIFAAMSNDQGAARFERELARATGKVESLQKNKCRAFFARFDASWNEEIFAEWQALDAPTPVPGSHFTSRPGVFSHGRIDAGSELLTRHLPASLHGSFADFGAGWGFLSDHVLKQCPNLRKIDLYEADLRALDCARANLADPAEREINFHWHDVTAGVPGTYDGILMNPPFHSGRQTDLDLGLAFIRAAHGSLRRGGVLWMVANRQLPYEATLQSLGFSWWKRAEDATYKIIQATRR